MSDINGDMMKLSTKISKRQFRQAFWWLHQNIGKWNKAWRYDTDSHINWVRLYFYKEEDFVLFCLTWYDNDLNSQN